MKTLASYLADENVLQSEFATRVGLSQSTVCKIANGTVGVSLKTALRIFEATGGNVDMNSLNRSPAE